MSQNMEAVLEILFGCIRCEIGNVKHEEGARGIEDLAGYDISGLLYRALLWINVDHHHKAYQVRIQT
jgi:hypothetical protein